MAAASLVDIEVVYALPEQQTLLALQVPEGATLEQAIRQSGILETHPEIDLAVNKVGVFSQVCELGREVRQGDRIEIYRDLQIDPMEARRRRAGQ